MEIIMGKKICDLRKKRELTQKDLALAIGVSPLMVSKWERDLALPNTSHLPDLARTLGVDVSFLLDSSEEIKVEQIISIVKQCAKEMEVGNINAGLALCKKHLQENPASLFLKYRLSIMLQAYFTKVNSEEKLDKMINMATDLLSETAGSKELEIKLTSLFMLSNLEMLKGNYQEAINILNLLPKSDINPEIILSTIYFAQGDFDNSTKIEQKILFTSLNSSFVSLNNLYRIAKERKDYPFALDLMLKQRLLIQAVSLEPFMLPANCLLLADIYAQMGDKTNTLAYLKEFVDCTVKYSASSINLAAIKLFDQMVSEDPAPTDAYLKENALYALLNNPTYALVKELPEFADLVAQLRAL